MPIFGNRGHWSFVAIIPSLKRAYWIDPLNFSPSTSFADLLEVAMHNVNDNILLPFEIRHIQVLCSFNSFIINASYISKNKLLKITHKQYKRQKSFWECGYYVMMFGHKCQAEVQEDNLNIESVSCMNHYINVKTL